MLLLNESKTSEMKIEIVPYNPTWNTTFSEEKDRLLKWLGHLNPKIEHIGSTSVQGMSAKPIIDIMIGLSSEDDLNALPRIFQDQQTYVYFEKYEETLPYRRFFAKVIPPNAQLAIELPKIVKQGEDFPEHLYQYRVCHIHAVVETHTFWEDHLLFRDLLRRNPIVREQYGYLKKDLARIKWRKSDDYSKAKTEFIQGCLEGMKRPI